MKTLINMVFRLKSAGMDLDRAVRTVAQGYSLTADETERLAMLVNLK